MIWDYLRRQKPDLSPDTQLPMIELPMQAGWERLPARLFQVTDGTFAREVFLISGDTVLQLGTAVGGQGVTSIEVSDLDQDGSVELLFTYSFGSGIHQSRIGMYAPAYGDDRIYEAETTYLGDIGLFQENMSTVEVRVVETDDAAATLRYLDTLGHLSIQPYDDQVRLVLQVDEGLPEELLQNLKDVSAIPTAESPPAPTGDKPDSDPIPFGLIYQAADALWHVNVDGEAVKILEHPGDGYAGPAISPDGTQVVYAEADDIWLAEIATGERRNLTQTPERRECCAQWWSNRADWIVFSSWPAEVSGPNMGFVTVIRADGTGYQVLDDEEPAFTQPAPGPDGQTVAYDRAGQPWLHRANAGPEPLAFDLTAYEPQSDPPMRVVSPAWSPDGTRMAWVVGGDFAALGGWRLGVGVLDLQAGTASLLHPYEPVGRGGWPPAPVWSPDGRWLVFDTWAQDGDETGLWVARPNGEEEHHLNCGADRTWSPDGRWVACASVPPGHGARLFEAETWETYPLDLPSDARIVAWLDPTSNR
jgi:Tol biopolymer transport system component